MRPGPRRPIHDSRRPSHKWSIARDLREAGSGAPPPSRSPGRSRVFSEQISSRIKIRPEFEAALALAREIKTAAERSPAWFFEA